MKKTLLIKFGIASFLAMGFVVSFAANQKYTYKFDIQRPMDATNATACTAKTSLIKSLIGLDASYLSAAYLRATWTSSIGKDTYYEEYTSDVSTEKGYWFTASGIATIRIKNYCIKVVWDAPTFSVSHNADANVTVGSTYTVKEVLVYNADTIVYVFNVTIGAAGSTESVKTNQPDVVGRPSTTDGWLIRPIVRQNERNSIYENIIQVNAGDKITLGCDIIDKTKYTSGKYQWTKCFWNAKEKVNATTIMRSYKADDFVLTESATYEDGGRYMVTVRLTDTAGMITVKSYYYYVDVQDKQGQFKEWNTYTKLSYNFHSEYPNMSVPTKIHTIKKDSGAAANYYAGEWWSAFWGDDLNAECGIDSTTIYGAAENMVNRYDKDFAYIRDYMGWPPDLSARKGYKSFVYVFGSGLANDSESKETKGGYQSSTSTDGASYACVWASYYPFSRFRTDKTFSDSEYQCGAMVHEGIHAIFADLGACQGSSWFHEGGNTWLQGQVYARRDGIHGDAGFLDGGPFLAPHMPIECYSGWLQDGSYGGPAAQGVNMYNSSGSQVCTWRNYLGGVQYANAFPTVIANVCGDGVIPWIWRYCKNRILETMGDSIGDESMRDIIVQYRARQALFDLGGWDNSYRAVTNSYFGTTVKPEWSPYWINVNPYKITPYQTVELNDSAGWMAPDTLTNPGWSGGNIIPIHVMGDVANVEFRPEDTNMRALLCYRSKDGVCYYSQPVICGNMTIDLTKKPANDVIFCIVANTDYVYTGDSQRKHHWDYRLRFGNGAIATADPYIKWFYYENTLTDAAYEVLITGINDVKDDNVDFNTNEGVKIVSGTVRPGDRVKIDLNGVNASDVVLRIVGISGVVADDCHLNSDGTFTMPANIPNGLYVVTFSHSGTKDVFKIIVR